VFEVPSTNAFETVSREELGRIPTLWHGQMRRRNCQNHFGPTTSSYSGCPFSNGSADERTSVSKSKFAVFETFRQTEFVVAARFALAALCMGLFFVCCVSAQSSTVPKPIVVKVVVIAAFERGEDIGDAPGEFQLWVEREHLDQVLELPAGYRHVRMN
jgi:hypothetical protein